MRKSIAAVLACTMLTGCVYAPPPGYRAMQGYGYVASDEGARSAGEPYPYVSEAQVYPAPSYVEAYPNYGGAAVAGLALGALAGVAIAGTYGGYHRGYGGHRGGWGGGHRR